jgi:hypothetical protein
MNRALVITTINKPNENLENIAFEAEKRGIHLIIVGDTKTPHNFKITGVDYYSIERQNDLFPEFSLLLPTNHYSRKNIGYLVAFKEGAEIIQETDDDNIPYKEFWDPIPEEFEVDCINSTSKWFNVFKLFSDEHIWPRGFSLEHINEPIVYTQEKQRPRGLILQGFADDNPDVDAIYRLTRKLPIKFKKRNPVMLSPGNWCPFNSQNTIFRKEVFPLLYLPSFCSFRMTDIWRSFIAQKLLWQIGEGVIFHNSTVYQVRNEHNILRDFELEIDGYLKNSKIVDLIISDLKDNIIYNNLLDLYVIIAKKQFIGKQEIELVRVWNEYFTNQKYE